MIRQLSVCVLVIAALTSCSRSAKTPGQAPPPPQDTTPKTPPTDTGSATFAYGSDVSWVTQMEAANYSFYNNSGVKQDLFTILGAKGINAIRLRAWVNPSGGWCNTADVVAKALRAKAAGMSVMIDFHYSDSWADPSKQNKPAAWASLAFSDLVNAVNTYTQGVLDTLKLNGITPAWVQVGNEVSNGMLWPDGQASTSMANFAALVKSGYQATKAVFPSCKVIVHLANGYDNATYRWLFDGLLANGTTWDVIGMSLYPSITNFRTLDSQCLANMNDMITRYGKQVMISEVGMEADQPDSTKAFLTDIIAKTKTVSGGLGVFYWEPEAYNWQSYGLGAFGSNGEPTAAMDAF